VTTHPHGNPTSVPLLGLHHYAQKVATVEIHSVFNTLIAR